MSDDRKLNVLITHYSSLITYYKSVISPLNTRRQSCRVARVLHVVSDMSQVGASGFDLLDVIERFVQPKVRWMLFESQAVKHKRVQTAQLIHGFRWNLAEISCIRKIVEAVSHDGQTAVDYLQRRDQKVFVETERRTRYYRVGNHLR